MRIEKIAKVAHEVNKAYCESLGDCSQPSWQDAPDWQKDSIVRGVKYHLENSEVTPAQSHENWRFEKFDQGFVYGEVKDEVAKTHPCCVPYEDLPDSQKAKDFIFRQIVHSLKVI